MPSETPTQIGPYRIVRLIAEGGMGAVYEAIQEPLGRRVAVKVLLPEYAHQPNALTRFFNEARAVNLIEHPSLIQISEFGQASDGTPFLVMEYLRGESLTQRLDRLESAGQRMSVVEALQITGQIGDALMAAHDKGIVHRDLKPSNVMMVPDPAMPSGERIKVLDFGIAKLTKGKGQRTATNIVMGTPQYMSPEQCRGAGEVDDRTDVYSLGVILYEMLAGRTPFVGEGSGDFIGQHLFKEPPQLQKFAPNTPKEVAALVHQLLLKDKTVRPTMRAVCPELSRLLTRLPGGTLGRPTQMPLVDTPASDAGESRGPASTLGRSLGETLRPARISRRPFLIGGTLFLVVASLIALSARSSLRPALRPARIPLAETVAQPSTPPSVQSGPSTPDVKAAPARNDTTGPSSAFQPQPAPTSVVFAKPPSLVPKPAPPANPPRAIHNRAAAADAIPNNKRSAVTAPPPRSKDLPVSPPPKRHLRIED